MNKLKARYNEALAVLKKAEAWFRKKDIPFTEKEKHRGRFKKVVYTCSDVIDEIEAKGYMPTGVEIREGFNL